MRKVRIVVCGLLGALALLACHGCTDRDASARSRGFRDDFNGTQLNHGLWNTCHWWASVGCTIGSNDELEWYLPSQVRVQNGMLRLVAEHKTVYDEDGEPFEYTSGMITTGPPHGSWTPKFAFRYGRAEIRAKVPYGRGLWPAFWLLPASRVSKPEIDVMEILGQEPRTVRMHMHWRDDDGETHEAGQDWTHPRAFMSAGWHRYAVDWRPGRLTWLVDGIPRWRVRGSSVPNVPMYLIINLAVGGWAGAPGADTQFPNSFKIDWVRVTR